jgi:hypothetical protein
MKFDIKKLYKSTIKTLEAHQMEVTIAIAALSMMAFAPDPEEEKANSELKTILTDLHNHLAEKINTLKYLAGE